MSEALNCYNVRIGDKLRVVRKWEEREVDLSFIHWVPPMDSTIGCIGTVIGVTENTVNLTYHEKGAWNYIYEVLERVTDEVPAIETVTYTFTAPKEIFPFQPYSDVLVRSGVTHLWERERFFFFKNDNVYPYVCYLSRYKFCIPYEGNEHLEGTTLPEGTHKTPKISRVNCCGTCQHFHRNSSTCRKVINSKFKVRIFNVCGDFITEEDE